MKTISRNIFIISIIAILLIITPVLPLKSSTQHGFIAKIFYAPYGMGDLLAPYYNESISSVSPATKEGKFFSVFSGYKLTPGYFYGPWHCELSYFKSSMKNQVLEFIDGQKHSVTSDLKFIEFKFGRRFQNPGDTSYNWLYISGKKMDANISISNTSISGTGYTVGYYGFHSIGSKKDFEFVFDYDLYLGRYAKTEYSSDIGINGKRIASITTGLNLGAGVQYEPYNISALLKINTDLNYISHEGTFSGSSVDLDTSIIANYIGLELIYVLPNFKYNVISQSY